MARETLEEHVVEERVEETEVEVCDECGDVIGEVGEIETYTVAVNPEVDGGVTVRKADYDKFEYELNSRSFTAEVEEERPVAEIVADGESVGPRFPQTTMVEKSAVEVSDALKALRRAESADLPDTDGKIVADSYEEVCEECAEEKALAAMSEPSGVECSEREQEDERVTDGFISYSGKAYVFQFFTWWALAWAAIGLGAAVNELAHGNVDSAVVAGLATLFFVGVAWWDAVSNASLVRNRKNR